MDPIGSNPFLNPTQLFSQPQSARQSEAGHLDSKASTQVGPDPVKETGPVSDYSKLFDDDALLKLQQNLESIAEMADSALKTIDR